MGFEPTTLTFATCCSPPELPPLPRRLPLAVVQRRVLCSKMGPIGKHARLDLPVLAICSLASRIERTHHLCLGSAGYPRQGRNAPPKDTPATGQRTGAREAREQGTGNRGQGTRAREQGPESMPRLEAPPLARLLPRGRWLARSRPASRTNPPLENLRHLDPSPMPATRQDLFARLAELGISTHTVEHEAVFTVAQSSKLERELPGGHTKNLFLKDKKDRLFLV